MKLKPQKGFVALITVLILGAASLAIASTILLSATDDLRLMLITQTSIQARNLATACAEEGLEQIHDNNAFTGSATLTMGQGTCSYTVTKSGSNRTVTTRGSVNNVIRKLTISATISAGLVNINSWQETS